MVSEIQPQDIRIMLYNISTTTLTKAQKRWRLAYFTIYFSNSLVSIAKNVVSKKLPISEISPAPSDSVIEIIPQIVVPKDRINDLSDHASGFCSIDPEQLTDTVKSKNLEKLHKLDGVKGVAEALETNLENGINCQDLNRRRSVFGSNTYENPPPKGLLYFVAEAFKDTTILIILGCAALSLGFGIKEHGVKEGWYEGGSIFVAVFLVIVVSAISNFRQERQFDSLSKISNNIKIDIVRERRRQKISIFDIVVGDVVILSISIYLA